MGVGVVLALVLALGVPPAWEFTRGVSLAVFGCSPPTQLRMVASPETLTTARSLAGDYERWTATENHDCPTVEIYVYGAPPDEIRERIQRGTEWLDGSDVLGRSGRSPTSGSPPRATNSPTRPARRSPAPRPSPTRRWCWLCPQPRPFSRSAGRARGRTRCRGSPTGGWTSSERIRTQRRWACSPPHSCTACPVRTTRSPQQLAPAEIEQRIAVSLDRGGFPLTDTSGLLCRHRLLGSAAAVIASEQQVVQVNLGDPLGPSCLSRTDNPEQLVALYPSDTRSLDKQFVRLSWSEPPQQQAAADFGAWLLTESGRTAVVRTGLRPIGPYARGPTLTTRIDTGAVPTMGPVPPAEWEGTLSAHDAAQRRGRVLFVLDTSGSMATRGPEGTRSGVAAAAVSAALGRMGPVTSSASGSSPTQRAPATSRPCRSARPTRLGATRRSRR